MDSVRCKDLGFQRAGGGVQSSRSESLENIFDLIQLSVMVR